MRVYMEILTILKDVRDPAVFLFCVGIVFYLNRNYVSKDAHEELKRDLHAIRNDYVSKEKLTDVLKPVEDQLRNIGREIGELKKWFLENVMK